MADAASIQRGPALFDLQKRGTVLCPARRIGVGSRADAAACPRPPGAAEPDGSCQSARIRPSRRKRACPSWDDGISRRHPRFAAHRPRRSITRRARGGRSLKPGPGRGRKSQNRGSRHRVRGRRTSQRACSKSVPDVTKILDVAELLRRGFEQSAPRRQAIATTVAAKTAQAASIETIRTASGDI